MIEGYINSVFVFLNGPVAFAMGFFVCLHMGISIIIPVYNEAAEIGGLVDYLYHHGGAAVQEIIVSDAGSTDGTAALAEEADAIVLQCPQKGRAVQMNHAAAVAKGDVLYFVHADTLPPTHFHRDIRLAVAAGYAMGRYRSRYDTRDWRMRFNAWFTRFDWLMCMGGDQTLFVTADLFARTGGFNPSYLIMEEYEFCSRARQQARYKIFPHAALISARKYKGRSWWQVQKANYTAMQLYKKGTPPQQIADTYQRMLQRQG
jgi:rSAM/selenodomain-associated transferase 2